MPYPTESSMICRDCSLKLPISKFSRNGKKDGYRRPECRKCQHINSKRNNPNYLYTKGSIEARNNHKFSRSVINAIKSQKLLSQAYECVYCISVLDDTNSHLDHITPLAKGGSNDSDNFQALCSRCNFEKHSKNHNEYIDWLKSHNEHFNNDRRGKI